MAYLINLVNFKDTRGELTVLDNAERLLPFSIKRVFYIYKVDESVRGGHRHHETIQAAICINGSCAVWNNDGENEVEFLLDNPSKCLILEAKDWHKMYKFSADAVLLVFASTTFDSSDYIYQPYPLKA
ncbi:MAG: WxcM-like domain-containing protein [Sphingobacteriia bacterium]|nr:MAG: WxcM-like domain-containing protein [Sphingobacteriia bacterium]TAG31840.1 MAG: WxcM-like domain-containing protein [Sphingobacteriia bacterium]